MFALNPDNFMSSKQNVKAMPSHPRPRGFSSGGGSGSSSSGRSAAQNTPMSERQQMALLMQMTSSNQAGKNLMFERDVKERN